MIKYYGVCYDTSPDLQGDDYVSLHDAYKLDAWRYLAYFTLTKSPEFYAGTGSAAGSSDIICKKRSFSFLIIAWKRLIELLLVSSEKGSVV